MSTESKNPEQFIPVYTNELRKELEAKINEKLDKQIFYWIAGLAIPIIGVLFTGLYIEFEKIHDVNDKVIQLETKMDNKK